MNFTYKSEGYFFRLKINHSNILKNTIFKIHLKKNVIYGMLNNKTIHYILNTSVYLNRMSKIVLCIYMKSVVNFLKLQESGENYLEAILILERRNGIARSVDVANELNVSKPSVSRAVSILKNAGYVEVGNINQLLLTSSGRKIAEKIYERHCFIKNYLIQIGVNQKTAEEDACRMEHIISEETFEKIKEQLKQNLES